MEERMEEDLGALEENCLGALEEADVSTEIFWRSYSSLNKFICRWIEDWKQIWRPAKKQIWVEDKK